MYLCGSYLAGCIINTMGYIFESGNRSGSVSHPLRKEYSDLDKTLSSAVGALQEVAPMLLSFSVSVCGLFFGFQPCILYNQVKFQSLSAR